MGPFIPQAAYLLIAVTLASAANLRIPTFSARRDYPGLFSDCVQVADTNGDRIPDLIGINGGYVQVLLGAGDGTFSAGPTTHTVISFASSFIATDLTGSGKIDLVMAGEITTGGARYGIAVSLGNGDGTFQYGTFYQAGTNNHENLFSAALGDFDGDGILDIATAGASGIWLFTGKGDGSFNPAVLAVAYKNAEGQIAAADFNDDHKLDLVVTLPFAGPTGAGTGFLVLLGNGDGTFQAPAHLSTPKQPAAVAVGTLTQGGYPSIVLSSYTNTDVYVYIGNGTGAFAKPAAYSLPVASGVAIGDVNGDGIPDLVSTGGYIALGKGNGAFKTAIQHPVETIGPYNVVLADLRNDGRTDIVTDSHSAISVLLSLGKGKYEDGNWTPVTGGAGCGAAADYNGDGKSDLAVNTANGITILLGTGKSGSPFTTGSTITLVGAGCLITGDLNNDGIPDLLVPANGVAIVYLGNGDGTFTEKSSTAIPTGGYLVLADFNHDGKLDLATTGNLLALGNGDGTFQTPAPFIPNPPQAPGGIGGIAAGDLNGDGYPDVVLTNWDQDFIYVLLNNQHGGFTQTEFQAPTGDAYEPDQVVLVDLNGDGNLDAVTASIYGGGLGVYLGDGKGDLTYVQGLYDPISVLGPFVVGDVNGDGIPDICLEEGGTVAVYLGIGNGTFEGPSSSQGDGPYVGIYVGVGPAPGDILLENLHGQSRAAGIPDIVAPDVSGGVTVLINRTK